MKLTAQILAFYMLLGSFIPNSDFSRLIHIHDMIAHYQDHVEEAECKGLTFSVFDFFISHLLDPNGHQHEDGNNHDNCPFRFFHSTTTFAISTFEFYLPVTSIPVAVENPSYKNAFYLKGFVTTEIQPPALI